MFFVCMLLLMLVNASSMFEINILVAIIVMFNILELIMKLLPNYSTVCSYGTVLRCHYIYARRDHHHRVCSMCKRKEDVLTD